MIFADHAQHQEAQIRPSLLWEYELERFDWQSMRPLVVQRVIERGRPEDFYAALNIYGWNNFKETIKEIPIMTPKDITFVCAIFRLKKEELKCYSKKPYQKAH